MFVASSSTADWARARASATVRLQDGAGVATRCEERASDMCLHETGLAQTGDEGKDGGRKIRLAARQLLRVGRGRDNVRMSDYRGST
jgi:hypothetical protein